MPSSFGVQSQDPVSELHALRTLQDLDPTIDPMHKGDEPDSQP
jgi:hypothetical protein